VRFGKASTHRHPDDQIEVDLHRTLVLGPFGLWIDPEELMDRRVTFELGGRDIPRLDDTGMFLNVAMHAALGWKVPRVVPLRDMAQVASIGVVARDQLARWATDWHAGAVLERAFALSEEVLGARPQAVEMLGGFPARDRRLAALHGDHRRDAGGTAVSTLWALPGVRARAAYTRALLVPNHTFLLTRTSTGKRRLFLRRASTPVRWVALRSRAALAGAGAPSLRRRAS
jgi:hypothetical protein